MLHHHHHLPSSSSSSSFSLPPPSPSPLLHFQFNKGCLHFFRNSFSPKPHLKPCVNQLCCCLLTKPNIPSSQFPQFYVPNNQANNTHIANFLETPPIPLLFPWNDENSEEGDELGLLSHTFNRVTLPDPPWIPENSEEFKIDLLRRRQVKMEIEAWEEAAREYRDFVEQMCKKKLAPHLPYIKNLFLGWFEPLRDAIKEDQEAHRRRTGNRMPSYGQYIVQLPADMLAVITMHKLMVSLMNVSDGLCTKVVYAACHIGQAVEQEVRLRNFFQTTKKENVTSSSQDADDEEHYVAHKLVKKLLKCHRHRYVQVLLGGTKMKPWTKQAHAQLGGRLLELLIETAYIQPPLDQVLHSPPNIRPAFKHTFKTVVTEPKKAGKRYGVIECDPLVHEGLHNSGRHLVIPYMPMLIQPEPWTGYESGGHLFLPSYVMRTMEQHNNVMQSKVLPGGSCRKSTRLLIFLGGLSGGSIRKCLI